MIRSRRRTIKTFRGLLALVVFVGAAIGVVACGGGGEDSSASEANGEGLSVQELVPLLTRYGIGQDGMGIDLTYAPPLFFELTGLKAPAEFDSRPTVAFILQETVHDGELPIEPSSVLMETGNGSRVPPYSVTVTAEDPHHRTIRLLFPEPEEGTSVSDGREGESLLRLVVPRRDGTVSVAGTFEWELPIELGQDG